VTEAAKEQGYRTAAEILAEQTTPEELQRRLWALEEQLARHQRWLQAHEAAFAKLSRGASERC
jgi:type IV secretory pathway VirD2 relaxase